MWNDWFLTRMWWIKIWKGYLRSEESQPHTRPPSPGFQCQEDKSAQLLAAKNQWGLSWWKKLIEAQKIPPKEPIYRLTYSDSLCLSSITGVAA